MPRFACMELMWGGVEGAKFEPWLREVRACGFEGVALRAATLRGTDGARALLAKHNLKLAAAYLPLHDADAHLETLARALAELDCADVVLHGGARGGETERAAAAKRIEELGARAAKRGLRASYHHHSGTPFETLEEAEALLRGADPEHLAGFCDTGHATQDFAGHPAERRALLFLERNWARMRVLEFKGWTPERGLNSELGEGPCDLAALSRFLCERRYASWIVLEQNAPAPGRLPRESAARSLAVARALFRVHEAVSSRS